MLARRRETARLVVLGTYRPVELILRAHPLKQAKAELQLHGHCAELVLSYLPETAVAAYVAHHFPAPVAPDRCPRDLSADGGASAVYGAHDGVSGPAGGARGGTGEELAAWVAAVADAIPIGVQQLIELQLGQLQRG